MAMICAICSLSGTVADVMLMPHPVVYRGYSLCEEHLRMWEANRELDWYQILDLARPKPTETAEFRNRAWEAAPEGTEEMHIYEDKAVAVMPDGEEVTVLLSPYEEKIAIMEEVIETASKPKPRRNRKSKKKGGKKK